MGNPVETRVRVEDAFTHASPPATGGTAGLHRPDPAQPAYERVVKTTYDVLGRVTRVDTTGGRDASYVAYEYAPAGTLRRLRRSPLDGSHEFVVEYEYDPRGLLTDLYSAAYTPAQLHKKITYDENGNETEVRETDASATVHKEYDGFDRLALVRYASGAVHRFEYEPRGHVRRATVDGPPAPGQAATRLYSAEFAYDAYGDLIHKAVAALKGGAGQLEQSWQFDRHVRLARIVAPNNGITAFAYDIADRVTRVTDPLGDVAEYAYDNRGYLATVTREFTERHVEPATARQSESRVRRTTESAYDALGRVVAVYGDRHELRQQFAYDSEGNVRAVYTPGSGQVEYLYDGMGRRIATRRPDGFELTAFNAAGLAVEYDDGQDHVRRSYDAQGRLVREEDVNGGAAATFAYDDAGRLREAVDRNGTIATHHYDAAGMRHDVDVKAREVRDPSGDGVEPVHGPAHETFELDALGRVVRASTDQDSTVEMTYDGLGRVLVETQRFRAFRDTVTRRFAPDLSWYELGYPAIAGAVEVRRNLDLASRTVEVDVDGKPAATYVYGGPDRVAARTLGNGYRTRFDHDARDRLTRVTADLPLDDGRYRTLWSQVATYGPFDAVDDITETWQPLGLQPGHVMQTRFARDQRGRIARTTTHGTVLQGAGTAAGPEAASFTEAGAAYHYAGDSARQDGMVQWGGGSAQTEVASVRRDQYRYDARGRIEQVITTGRDGMTGKRVPTADYAALASFVGELSGTVADAQDFRYDRLGHLVADGRFNYSYDYRGRLTRVVDRWAPFGYTEAIFFYYDALGRRIAAVPSHDGTQSGLLRWGPEWHKQAQWFVYDGHQVLADVCMCVPAGAASATAPAPLPRPRLIARYFAGALPGERLRMDRRAEDALDEDLRTFYLHQDLDGKVRFVTDLYARQPVPIVHRNGDVDVDEAQPARPPGDAYLVAGTRVRVPYVTGNVRVDGFAATAFREDYAEAVVDFGSAFGYARKVDHDRLREDRLAQQDRLQYEALAAVGLLASGPLAIEAGPGVASWMARTGFVRNAATMAAIKGSAAVVAGQTAAWMTRSAYSLGEATGDFASNAAWGPVDALVAGMGLGAVKQLAFDALFNVGVGTGQSVLQGMDLADALGANVRQGITGAFAGFLASRAIGVAGRGIAALGEAASRRIARSAAQGAAPAGAAQPATGEIRYVDQGSLTEAQQQAGPGVNVVVKSQSLQALDNGILSALDKDGPHARLIARLIRRGELEVRYYRNAPGDVGQWNAYTYASRNSAEHGMLYLNLDTLVRNPARGSFERYELASVVVHEAIHALGGSEIAAFIGESRFMFETVVRRNATLEQVHRWFGADGKLAALYDSSRDNVDVFRDHVFSGQRYTWKAISLGDNVRESTYVRAAGGWASFLGITDPRLDVIEQWARGEY
jgi:YD repeat-containing protein